MRNVGSGVDEAPQSKRIKKTCSWFSFVFARFAGDQSQAQRDRLQIDVELVLVELILVPVVGRFGHQPALGVGKLLTDVASAKRAVARQSVHAALGSFQHFFAIYRCTLPKPPISSSVNSKLNCFRIECISRMISPMTIQALVICMPNPFLLAG